MSGEPDYSIKPSASSKGVLEWAETQVPVSIAVFDGENSYKKSNPHPSPSFENHPEPKVYVHRGESLFSSSRQHNLQWSYANRPPGQFQRIEEMPEDIVGCIGLRIDAGDIRRDFYIDPEHDYICVRKIWWKKRLDNWEREREYEYFDFVQLPGGQWYTQRRNLVTYEDSEKEKVQGEVHWNVDFTILEEDEYPPGTFNGEKLLEEEVEVISY